MPMHPATNPVVLQGSALNAMLCNGTFRRGSYVNESSLHKISFKVYGGTILGISNREPRSAVDASLGLSTVDEKGGIDHYPTMSPSAHAAGTTCLAWNLHVPNDMVRLDVGCLTSAPLSMQSRDLRIMLVAHIRKAVTDNSS
jgi:hypothetical protein